MRNDKKRRENAASSSKKGWVSADLGALEEALGYHFHDRELLARALTHSSYINEHDLTRLDCNERLEFLGDAVLELVSSEFLYSRYPESPEGELTKRRASLVSEPPLSLRANRLGLGGWMRLAKGADDTGGRFQPSILSDAVESVIGAIYLDGGLDEARAFILKNILDDPDAGPQNNDNKTMLQELTQRSGGLEPEYVLISAEGPDHDRVFTSQVLVGGKVMGEGRGR